MIEASPVFLQFYYVPYFHGRSPVRYPNIPNYLDLLFDKIECSLVNIYYIFKVLLYI